MTIYQMLFLAWVLATAGLTVVVLYRSIVELHEDDQLFLDPVEAAFEREQKEIVQSLNGLDKTVLRLASLSGALFALMVAIGVFRAVV